MYKLLIVDDEPAIRQGIANSNPWKTWGFVVSALCENGREALREIEKECPDVVLSDIRMPKMDGIELMKYLKENNPQIKIIILSGYSDFKYLNQAIENGVTSYLLKPTDIDAFERLFIKLKKDLDAERSKEEKDRQLLQEWRKGQESQQIGLLKLLLKGYTQQENIEEVCRKLTAERNIYFDNCYVTVAAIDGRSGDEKKEQYLLKQRILSLCNSSDDWNRTFFLDDDENIVWIFSKPPTYDISPQMILDQAKAIQAKISESLEITVSAGISDLCTAPENLPQCYAQAQSSSKQSVFLGYDSVFMYSQFEDQLLNSNLPTLNVELIKQSIMQNSFSAANQALEDFFTTFSMKSLKEYSYVDLHCIETLLILSRWAMRYHIQFVTLLDSLGTTYTDIYLCDSLEKKKDFLSVIIYALMGYLKQRKEESQKYSGTAYLIQKCVDEEFANINISLEYVAAKLDRNPTYISKVFKQELGYNFSSYLMNKRIEHSKALLQNPSIKIYKVAEEVGYVDTSNFIKVFKKQTGISPNEYRTLLRNKTLSPK